MYLVTDGDSVAFLTDQITDLCDCFAIFEIKGENIRIHDVMSNEEIKYDDGI
jgi:hypothetical protein